MTITLDVQRIIDSAEQIGSPYDAPTHEALNIMEHDTRQVLDQLRALKYAMSDGVWAYKAVRVSSLIATLENKLLVIEDARGDMQ